MTLRCTVSNCDVIYVYDLIRVDTLKLIIVKGGLLKFNAIRCLQAAVLNSPEWQKKILSDPEFVEQLINKPDESTWETTWAFLAIVAQHFGMVSVKPHVITV